MQDIEVARNKDGTLTLTLDGGVGKYRQTLDESSTAGVLERLERIEGKHRMAAEIERHDFLRQFFIHR